MAERGTVVKLAPEHEQAVIGDIDEIADEPIQMVLNVQVTNAQNPETTYWEVTYLSTTPHTNFGETRILSEEIIEQFEHVETEEVGKSEQYCIEFSDSPSNKWNEMKEQRTINRRRVASSSAQAWAGQKTD